jgi:hypothetical protein
VRGGPTHLRERWGAAAGPVALVLLTILVLWFGFGVTLADAATYVGYEVGVILLPG